MSNNPKLRPENDARAVGEALSHAMLLTYRHGQDFPAFAEIMERLRAEHRRLEEIDDQRQVAAGFGFVADLTMQHLAANGFDVDSMKSKRRRKER